MDEHVSRKLTASMKDLNHDGNKELILGFLINKKYHVTGIYYYQPKKGAIPYQLFKKADSYRDTIVTDQNHVIIVNKKNKGTVYDMQADSLKTIKTNIKDKDAYLHKTGEKKITIPKSSLHTITNQFNQ